MTILPFPEPRLPLHPLVEMVAPDLSPSGLYEVTIWRSLERDEGYLTKVPTLADAMSVIRIANETLKGEGRK